MQEFKRAVAEWRGAGKENQGQGVEVSTANAVKNAHSLSEKIAREMDLEHERKMNILKLQLVRTNVLV